MDAATETPVEGEVVEHDEVPLEDRALIPTGGGLLVDTDRLKFGDYFEMTRIGMTILGRPSLEVCADMAKVFEVVEQSVQFAFGDFMNWAEGVYGEEASQLIPDNEYSQKTQKQYQWVASKVAPHVRNEKLSFQHHMMVAKLNTVEEQKLWLDRASEGVDGRRWTVRELKKAMDAAARDVIFNPGEPKYVVVIECESHDDVVACCRQLDNLGRTYTTKEPATR